jgi:hypothetical protein
VSLLWGALVFVAVAAAMTFFRAPGWAAFVELSLAFALILAFSSEGFRVRRAARLHADMEGLRVDAKLVVVRSEIATAYLLATEQPTVRVVPTSWPQLRALDVVLDDEGPASALLEALGFASGHSIASFRAMRVSWWIVAAGFSFFVPAVVGVGTLVHFLGRWPGFVTFHALYVCLSLLLVARISTRVDVGSDGILLRRLGERRFISYGALEGASVHGRQISLSVRPGKRLRLRLLGTGSEAEISRDALLRRIEEAQAAFVASRDTEGTEALIAPGGRAVAEWVRDIRALARARDYREARVETERLWNVVGDASAAPATRAGAAVALATAAENDARARLRVASEACADPKLRTALVRVADGASDEALAEALAPLVVGGDRSGSSTR